MGTDPIQPLTLVCNERNPVFYTLEFNMENLRVLDVEMGTVTGIEAAKQLKRWNPQVNIIFVTGYDKYMADAFKLICNDFCQE